MLWTEDAALRWGVELEGASEIPHLASGSVKFLPGSLLLQALEPAWVYGSEPDVYPLKMIQDWGDGALVITTVPDVAALIQGVVDHTVQELQFLETAFYLGTALFVRRPGQGVRFIYPQIPFYAPRDATVVHKKIPGWPVQPPRPIHQATTPGWA